MLTCEVKNILWICVVSCIANAVFNLLYLHYFYQHPQFLKQEEIPASTIQANTVHSKLSMLLLIFGVLGLTFLNYIFQYLQTDPYNKIFFKTVRFVLISIYIVLFAILSQFMFFRLQLVNNTKKSITDFTKSHWQINHDNSLRIPLEKQKRLALENLVILVLTTVLATPVVLALMTLPRRRYREMSEKQRGPSPTIPVMPV